MVESRIGDVRTDLVGDGPTRKKKASPGDVEAMIWEVEGVPRNRMCLERLDSAHASAANVLNGIPDVIAARPGIVPISELGPIKSSAARWPRIGT